MTFETLDIPIKSLKRNTGQIPGVPKNPRIIKDNNFKKLKDSIVQDPEMLELREIIVYKQGDDYIIIGGNMRFEALKALNFEKAKCKVITGETTADQLKRIILKDNSAYGEWDFDELANEWEEALIRACAIDIPVFDEPKLKDEVEDDNFDVEKALEETKETICKRGDVWQLGAHRLMCGDSTNAADVALLMDGTKADMCFTDPPYGIGIDGQKESKCANPKHNRKAHEFRGWDNTRPDKSVFDYILSLNIPSVIFGGNYFADMLPATRGWIYWSKGQDGLTMSDGELAWTNVDKPLRCVTVNRANLGKTVHPTQKPLKVVEFCLDYAGEGEVVLDLFGGSGSTLIACEQLNRTCYMMELDPHYCDVIIARWEKLTGRQAVKLGNINEMPKTENTEQLKD